MADDTPDKGLKDTRMSHVEEVASPYVDREQEMSIAIEEGFEDYRNGHTVEHDTVKANLAEIVAKARKAAA